jgi:E3 ubiquitin-protein ligase RNF14
VLFEDTNQGRSFGLYEEPDNDDDSDDDEDQEELEPELPWLYPCPICGRQNEKVSYSFYLASRAGQLPLISSSCLETLEVSIYMLALCY